MFAWECIPSGQDMSTQRMSGADDQDQGAHNRCGDTSPPREVSAGSAPLLIPPDPDLRAGSCSCFRRSLRLMRQSAHPGCCGRIRENRAKCPCVEKSHHQQWPDAKIASARSNEK